MKKWLLVLAVLVAFCFFGVAYAESTTSGATYSSPNGEVCDEFIGFLNDQDYIDHTHQFDDPEYSLGLGVDVVVAELDPARTGVARVLLPDAIEVQSKWDFPNENGSTYLVAKYNLWKALTENKKAK
jgi:hypothetical protein